MQRAQVTSLNHSLSSILMPGIQTGDIQLPDFQRSWVWSDQQVRQLLASIASSYPIGAVMLLQLGTHHEFQFRPLQGVATNNAHQIPTYLVLDGQQRLTALHQALSAQRDSTELANRYYISIKDALDPSDDDLDAIVSSGHNAIVIQPNKHKGLNLSDVETQYEHLIIPAELLFDPLTWILGCLNYHKQSMRIQEQLTEFNLFVLEVFQKYEVPVITLGPNTSVEAVCHVFERVNSTGVKLSVFELMTAMFAATGFRLRTDWDQREIRLRQSKSRILSDWPDDYSLRDDFFQTVSLLATYGRWRAAQDEGRTAPTIGSRRKQILSVKREDYERWAPLAEAGWQKAGQFLHEQRIFTHRDLPYKSQLIPLAAIYAVLGEDADLPIARDVISRWFWCGVLGELYGAQPHSRFAADLPEVVAMARGRTATPKTISEADFATSRLISLRTRASAAYKGIYVLTLKHGAKDFFSDQRIDDVTFFKSPIDVHHVFPRKWCKDHGISADLTNSAINRTPLRDSTNKAIAAKSPSEYIALEKMASHAKEVLESHAIGIEHLRNDDFEGFMRDRGRRLLELIDTAMGKSPKRDLDELFLS